VSVCEPWSTPRRRPSTGSLSSCFPSYQLPTHHCSHAHATAPLAVLRLACTQPATHEPTLTADDDGRYCHFWRPVSRDQTLSVVKSDSRQGSSETVTVKTKNKTKTIAITITRPRKTVKILSTKGGGMLWKVLWPLARHGQWFRLGTLVPVLVPIIASYTRDVQQLCENFKIMIRHVYVCLLLWLPCVADADILFYPCGYYLPSSFFLLFFARRITQWIWQKKELKHTHTIHAAVSVTSASNSDLFSSRLVTSRIAENTFPPVNISKTAPTPKHELWTIYVEGHLEFSMLSFAWHARTHARMHAHAHARTHAHAHTQARPLKQSIINI